jgi:hypothetical protein
LEAARPLCPCLGDSCIADLAKLCLIKWGNDDVSARQQQCSFQRFEGSLSLQSLTREENDFLFRGVHQNLRSRMRTSAEIRTMRME